MDFAHLDLRELAVLTSPFAAAIFADDDFYFSDGIFIWVSRGGTSHAVQLTNAWDDKSIVAQSQRTFIANNERGIFGATQGKLRRSEDGSVFTFLRASGAEITAMTSSGGAIAYADKKGDDDASTP